MFKRALAIIHREFFYMWRDRDLRYILLLGPILTLLFFAFLYSAQSITAIPTAIVDLDHSVASRSLSAQFSTAENLQVTAFPENYAAVEQLLQKGDVVVGIIIPENFARDTAMGRQVNVAVMIDSSNMVYATNASNAVLAVTRTISAEIGINNIVASGTQLAQAQEAYHSIDFREEGWFNPTYNYAYFLLLAVVLNLWQQFCTLAASMNIIGETGRASWLQLKALGISKLQLFASKSVAHIIVFMAIVLPVYALAFYGFKLPLRCSIGQLLLLSLLFAVALHSIGTLVSAIASNALNATRFGMVIALPSFVLCGYTWPLEAMPQILQQLTWVLPQTWFFQGFNYLTFKNPGWDFLSHYLLALGLLAFVYYGLASVIITLKQARRVRT